MIYAESHEKFNKTNRFWIADAKEEIHAIIQESVFCVDKTDFPRSGHIYNG